MDVQQAVDRRARLAVAVCFCIMGSIIGNWSSRIPDVRRAVGLGDTGWGLVTTATTAGQLLSLVLVTVLVGRVRKSRLTLAGASLLLVNGPLMAGSTAPAALVCTLFVWGFAANLLATPVNAQAVEVERRYGRALMSTFHACFSGGTLAGGLLGSVAAANGITPQVQFTLNTVVLGVLLVATGRRLPDDPAPGPADDRRRRRLRDRLTPQLGLLAGMAFLASMTESAAGQWSAIYTVDSVGAAAAAGAVTFTCYSLAITAARFFGDRIADRIGRLRFLRLSVAVAGAGLALALAVPHAPAVFAGFAVLGLGLGCVTPTVMSYAGRQPGLTSEEGVSVAVLGQWPAYFIGPPLIGLLAGEFGLRWALWTLVVASALLALAGGGIRHHVTEPAAR
ncbi:MFS transporter [Catenuloplanes indicus]|uniref:MFS family permease n=1 Tax=Catenuloplanes indicus TaxID=137267 RepID=A0AAE3VVB4_9ACTN|nr:MFS transporter [Catenuloplanes indicus]MDQ0364918.1 MFS family permease [Catenuloplanes indicus]